ncbi:iron ABC transporter permease [Paracoccus sp. DMF-8]|uniref:FecCD family ABC transporter permease n=1 Tax=Paracoccus sp. DMF-8 TaxID=3019445 RepID=UPI0023E8B28E|nr:iron ABC transporter permease [Paracoccus sp. DMF-8]MDF3605226.1 iron ABC transporter permease [Paracoccus sp. DMF-8]
MSGATASLRALAAVSAGGLAVLMLAVMAGIVIGEAPLPLSAVLEVLSVRLFGADTLLDPIDAGIIWNYRLPRTLVAASCGAALSLSGLVLQSLVRNALADPYLLGVSAGASTGAVAVTILGVGGELIEHFRRCLCRCGAGLSDRRAAGARGGRRGGADGAGGHRRVAAFQRADVLFIAKSANAEQARGIMFWLLGNLSGVRWPDVTLAVPIAVLGFAACLIHARALDAFSFGTESAASLGVPVRRVQLVLIGAVTLMAAVMVSLVGAIGFVGLVIPHAMRFVVGVRHFRLIPATALAGAVFLIAADIVSRMLIAGQVVPIGVVTALVGAPGFAIILIRNRARA